MKRPGILLRLLPLILAWLALASASIASEDDRGYKVIVHPDNPVTSIERERLREVFLKKATEWDSGAPIRPIDLPTRSPVRERFTQDVLRKTPAQLRNYWNQQIFSGKGVPPPEAETTAGVIAYVRANPGAIGYLPTNVDAGPVKVVKVR
jgi:ABC-type phosphate transport system substrate-binding protein